MLKFYVIGVRKCICWRLSSGFHDAIRFSHVVKEKSEKYGLKLNIQKTKIMESDPMANRLGNGNRLYFGGGPKSLQKVTVVMKLKDACSLEEKL